MDAAAAWTLARWKGQEAARRPFPDGSPRL